MIKNEVSRLCTVYLSFYNIFYYVFDFLLVQNAPRETCQQRVDNIYDECYDNKHCFGFHPTNPERCVDRKDCTMMTTLEFYRSFDDSVDIQLTAAYSNESEYIAMAFSDTSTMGKDLVFACSWSWPHREECKVYWNENFGGKSELLNDKQKLPRVGCFVYRNGRFTVEFLLDNHVVVKGQEFDFEKGYYLLLARGLVKGDEIEKHTAKIISSVKFGIDGVRKGN